MIPRATYRLQFHAGFPFAAAEAILPYLSSLGVSHLYASPIAEARPGSLHGYDVVDPTRVSEALGGEAGFRRLASAARAHGLGIVLDIVPNHMAADARNPWWWDLLAHGRESRYAPYFDVDWNRHGGRLLLPFLGAPLEEVLRDGQVAVERSDGRLPELLVYGEQRYPLRASAQELGAAAAGADGLAALLQRQSYLLAWWRRGHDELNWRRFFSISELAGLRIEEPEVFEAVHALPLGLYAEGLIDGLRIDHVDGLRDPAGYLANLRSRLSELQHRRPQDYGPAWLVVEKILGPGESLPGDWPVDGTTGYEFMDQVSAVLHAPEGQVPLTRAWTQASDRPADFVAEEALARRQMLAWEFTAQLEACVDAFAALATAAPETARYTRAMWWRAIETLLQVFPVYRTYGNGVAAPREDGRSRTLARQRALQVAAPGELEVVDHVLAWLAGEGPGEAAEAVRRFQQLSAPIAAKGVEDTAFYRYGRLLSRNDVGFDPAVFSLSPQDFLELQRERRPASLLATATHDHKRGEDHRARLAALSALPDSWIETQAAWRDSLGAALDGIDGGDLSMLFQTLIGAWPEGLEPTAPEALADYAERLVAWQVKALREAKLRSSWTAPDEAYESHLATLIRRLLDPAQSAAWLAEAAAFVRRLEPTAEAMGLVQTALKLTLPGVPDLYQGCEFRDFSLVDPDNRRPVDYRARTDALANGGHLKQRLIQALLGLRRAHPALFAEGDLLPLALEGPEAENIVAFARTRGQEALVCAMALRWPTEAGDAALVLPLQLADALGRRQVRLAELASLLRSAPPHDSLPVLVGQTGLASAP